MPDKQASFVIDVYDDIMVATIAGTPEWNRQFAAASEAQRRQIVAKLRVDARRRLDDLFHLLTLVGDPAAVEKLPARPELSPRNRDPGSATRTVDAEALGGMRAGAEEFNARGDRGQLPLADWQAHGVDKADGVPGGTGLGFHELPNSRRGRLRCGRNRPLCQAGRGSAGQVMSGGGAGDPATRRMACCFSPNDERLADLAGRTGVSASTVRRWVRDVIDLLAARSPWPRCACIRGTRPR